MSLTALIHLVERWEKYDRGELSPEETAAIQLQLAQASERSRSMDIELEKKVAAKRVSEELLNKTCSI